MRRRNKHAAPENHERWLVSYADFITLLFAFFVVMYSVSSVNEGKFRVLSDALFASFANRAKSLEPIQVGKLVRSPVSDKMSARQTPVPIQIQVPPIDYHASGSAGADGSGEAGSSGTGAATGNPAPTGDAGKAAAEPTKAKAAGAGAASGAGTAPGGIGVGAPGAGQPVSGGADDGMAGIDATAARLREEMAPLIHDGQVVVRRGPKWLEIEFKTSILFASGEAKISRDAVPVLARIAVLLAKLPNPVQVEGYADDVPIHTAVYPSNWELSAARAASVVHLLQQAGVAPERMAAIGYGEHRPIADNSTAEGRQRNRRVVIVIPATKAARRILDLDRVASTSGPDATASATGAPGTAAGAAPAPASAAPAPAGAAPAPAGVGTPTAGAGIVASGDAAAAAP